MASSSASSASSTLAPVSHTLEEARSQWQRDGYVILRDAVPAETVAALRDKFSEVVDGMIAKLKAEGLIEDEGKALPFETRLAQAAGKHAGRFGRSWRKLVASRPVYDAHYSPKLVELVAELLGTDVIGHPVYNARPKLPGQQLTVVPWHQDSGYFGKSSERSKILTAWVPLVPVDAETGCLQVVPNSNREGLAEHREEEAEGKFLEIVGREIRESDAVTCAMQPGDALVFDNLLYHRSLPNTSGIIRWSIDMRFVRDGDSIGDTTWPDPDFEWVIRSDNRPVTPFEAWMQQLERIPW